MVVSTFSIFYHKEISKKVGKVTHTEVYILPKIGPFPLMVHKSYLFQNYDVKLKIILLSSLLSLPPECMVCNVSMVIRVKNVLGSRFKEIFGEVTSSLGARVLLEQVHH